RDNAKCTFTATGDRGELVVRAAGGTSRKTLQRDTPTQVAKEGPTTKPPTDPKADVPGDRYSGVWTGTFPGTSYTLVLSVRSENDKWPIEMFLTNAQGKKVAYYENAGADITGKGKWISFLLSWKERPPDLKSSPTVTLTARPPVLHMEV